ncbi:MAG TPA: alpha-2-macroglobulin family protein, partial [Gemmatimonadaceae bacterium]|nr:alpha-2-macroglobulin family protein [Gemmatimonadaceae bacterium]
IADSVTRFAEDTATAIVHGRYLFGAPMRGGVVKWKATWDPADARALHIPNTDDWNIGGWLWWGETAVNQGEDQLAGADTLDSDGRARIGVPVATLPKGPGRLDFNVAVQDFDGQVVTATTSAIVSSSHVYLLARGPKEDAVWRVGEPGRIEVRPVDRNGLPVRDAVIRALVLHHYSRAGDPTTGIGARSVIDTVRTEDLRGTGDTVVFTFAPAAEGDYAVVLSATDGAGALSRTMLEYQVAGASVAAAPTPSLGYRLPIRAEDATLSAGDMARVRFDSPFDSAEAWITVEREGIIEQRRQRATRGENLVAIQMSERHVPNVFVSVVLLAHARSAEIPDTASDRVRAGYIELYVRTDPKRLAVALSADRASYAPRDTVAVRVRVRDAGGRGVRSEVAVWAVDEGVLALTGFGTPDPLAAIYATRGVGAPLWSTLPTILTSDPNRVSELVYMWGAMALNSVVAFSMAASPGLTQSATLRSRFNSTAFYLGSIVTDRRGDAVARAAVPDNLTTFRVMAVAVAGGDRYGSGDTTLLVTRPLVARPALPRFVRPSDSLVAGLIVTARDGRARDATAEASATGLEIHGRPSMSISLSSVASTAARFVITTPNRNVVGDSVALRLGASDGATADATETWLPVRPDFHPRSHAILGAVRDSQDLRLILPADVDPQHSRMRLRIGTSRISTMLAGYRWLLAYRYDCTEQLTSVGRGIVAVWRATRHERQDLLGGDPHAKLQELVDEISRRQDPDGSIQYWPGWHWSSPWLTAYAGSFLLDARDLGVEVRPGVISRASKFLHDVLRTPF